MDSVNFFSVASQHNRWLSVRQSVVAQNVANANTPGYKALDVQPFESVLQATGLEMKATSVRHMQPTGALQGDAESEQQRPTWDVVHSGNSVTLEEQLMKSSEITGQYNRNTTVMKTLHRMLLASSKG